MDWRWAFLAFAASFAASLGGTRIVLGHLRRRAILDHPNERSSHSEPTPRGGGLALVATLVPIWLLIAHFAPGTHSQASMIDSTWPNSTWPDPIWPAVGAILLAAVSWYDDLASAPILMRLSAQVVAVALGLLSIAGHGPVFQGLVPSWLDRAAAGFLWLWFVNLFNFMDGIDGIAASESAAIGIGVAVVATSMSLATPLPLYGLTAAAVALGFLWWNWSPARVFMGDVGSVPLGYLLGWLLLELSCRGAWAPALILPLYYLADATLTLLRRIARGAPFWRAHREHFYQRATQGGLSHKCAVGAVVAVDIALIGLALWAAVRSPWLPLILGVVAVAALLAYFGRRKPA